MKIHILVMATTSLTLACSNDDNISKEGARHTADAFIADQYSINNTSVLKISEKEDVNHWTFVYDAPNENWIGGPLEVTVDKKEGKVIGHRGNQ